MKTIKAHRQRVEILKSSFEQILILEKEIHDIRTESWELQINFDPNRDSDLKTVHAKITELGMEVEMLKEKISGGTVSSRP